MPVVFLARHAMATRFEIVLHGESELHLRAAGEEALAEIERIESLLSLYRPTSEIAHLNARSGQENVRVSPEVFQLLEHALSLSDETQGAFDITVAPLMRAWGFLSGPGQVPGKEVLAAARECVGSHLVQLNRSTLSVRFARPGVMLDLGAIGKGYAVGRAAGILRESGVASALIHGGTSTVHAIGHPTEASSWNIAIELSPPNLETTKPLLSIVPLCDDSLSVSAGWGKQFQSGTKTYGHVMDARTGEPAGRALLAMVALPSATETDAFSTALLTTGPDGQWDLQRRRPGWRSLVASGSIEHPEVTSAGLESMASNAGEVHRISR